MTATLALTIGVRALAAIFDPIPVDEIGGDRASLVDTSVVVEAVCSPDFEVDGNPTKPVWQKAKPLTDFVVRTGEGLKTDVRVLYSTKALYVAATLWQPMDRLTARLDQNDLAIYGDDCIEVFLFVPGKTEPDFIQMSVNANGNIYDAKNGRSGFRVAGMKLKTVRQADRWTMEMKLPYDGIRLDRPFAGDFIGVRFCRNSSDPKCVSSIPALSANSHNRRADFAKLVFLPPAGDAAALAEEASAYKAEVLRKRFYAKYDALKLRVSALSGSVAGVDRKVPVMATAFEAVRQLRAVLKDFEMRNSVILAKGALPPESERQALFALANGFDRFAGDKAYVVWPMDIWAKGAPTDRPPVDYRRVTQISFEQAGNEREAVGLYFMGLLSGPRLDLKIVPRATRIGENRILCDAFEVYEEKFVKYDGNLISEPLVRVAGNFVTLTPGVPVRIWVVFNSRDVKAGTYKTQIDLKPAWDENVPVQKIDVVAKVWNFSLPETRDWPLKSFFWGPNNEPNDETETLRLMHDHHVTHGWTRGFLYWHGLGPDGRILGKNPETFKCELAESANDEFFREVKRLGMRFVIGWNTPRCWEWFDAMAKRFRGMGLADEDFVFKALLADEFKRADIPKHAEARDAVASRLTNLWFQAVYLSTPPPSGATMDDIEAARLPEFYKMWTLIGDLANDPKRGPDVIRRLRAKGCSVWDYHCGLHMHGRDALAYYRNSPRKSYDLGLDGSAMWTSGRRRGNDAFDVSDGSDDGILWMGVDGRFISSKNFEAFREGLEDVAYVDRLKKEMAKRPALASPAYSKFVTDFSAQTKSPEQKAIDVWRLEIGRAIDKLVGK